MRRIVGRVLTRLPDRETSEALIAARVRSDDVARRFDALQARVDLIRHKEEGAR